MFRGGNGDRKSSNGCLTVLVSTIVLRFYRYIPIEIDIMRFVYIPIATIVSFLLFSCHKSGGSADAPGTRLKEVITHQAIRDSNVFASFKYNSNGQLVTYVDSFHMLTDNSNYINIVFSYPFQFNSQGNLERIDYRAGSTFAALYDLRTYDGQNRLIQNMHIDQYAQDTAVTRFVYDSNNRLTSDSTINSSTPGKMDYAVYTYDGNNNIVTWKQFTDSSGIVTATDSSNITYDANRNPYNSFGMNLYSLRNKEQLLSKNNITQQQFADGTIVNYQYTYFSNGLPKDVFVTVTSSASVPNRELHFVYE